MSSSSEPLLCGPDEDVVHHHVRGAAQHVAHLVPCVLYSLYYCIVILYCSVLYCTVYCTVPRRRCPRTGDTPRSCGWRTPPPGRPGTWRPGTRSGPGLAAVGQQLGGVIGEAGVTWRDAAHPDVAAKLPQLLPPALQQPRHRELGGRVEPGLCYITVTNLLQEMESGGCHDMMPPQLGINTVICKKKGTTV